MRILITAGPTREPIDPVRYIGNRSSGRMGAALADAALRGGHAPMLVVGPGTVEMPTGVPRINVETAAQMLDAVSSQFPWHDLLIMAAAVADYRPRAASHDKLPRSGNLTLELEPTHDIIAAAGRSKRSDQHTVGFSLESSQNLDRVRGKLLAKNLDLIVFNSTKTIGNDLIEPTLLYKDGRIERMESCAKTDFAEILVQRSVQLFQ